MPFINKILFFIIPFCFQSCTNNFSQAQGNDCLQWGEKLSRNMISPEVGLPETFNPETGKNIKWIANIGSNGYATPIVANEKVLIGANNAAQYDERHEGDRGTLLCFDEKDGSLIWQLIVPRIEGDRHNDWPMVGICSPPTVEGDKVYILTNNSYVLCLDINGQTDGNDGVFQGENWFVAPEEHFSYTITDKDADILWAYDLRMQLGMCPHDSPHASILLDGDYLYLNTCNGVDYRHLESACLNAPSLIVLDKNTGKLVAKDDENFAERIFHSSWSSPSMGVINGQKLVFFAGGDGILYAFEALPENTRSDKVQSLKKIWECDCDPDAPKENIHEYLKNREQSPSNFLGMPVFYENKIYVTVGGDIWWGKQKTWLKCIDAGSGREIWSDELEKHSAATPAISNGLVYVTDCNKNVHCVDAKTGKQYWKHQMERDSWSSAMVADGKIYVGSRGGDLWILKEGKELNILHKVKLDSPIHSTPTMANGTIYISTMNKLFAIQ